MKETKNKLNNNNPKLGLGERISYQMIPPPNNGLIEKSCVFIQSLDVSSFTKLNWYFFII